jgi:16S rRNA processing protein RimM
MNLIYIGKLVNTHGIKGEVRLISNFKYKEEVFKIGNIIYINNKEYKINSYRVHKMFDMITLDGYSNINEVLKYKGERVYFLRSDLSLKNNEYILDDIIGFDIIEDEKNLGKIIDFMYNKSNTLLVIEGIKKFYIPFVDNFIIKVDLKNKKILTRNAKDLIL